MSQRSEPTNESCSSIPDFGGGVCFARINSASFKEFPRIKARLYVAINGLA